MNNEELALHLNAVTEETSKTSKTFKTSPVLGAEDTLQVDVIGREEIPTFISITEGQIICIAYLFDKNEVIADRIHEMNDAMLKMNLPLQLSCFTIVDDKYALIGQLSTNASFEDIEEEISTLSDNTLSVIENLNEFLV